jgi:hypothetical protein
MTDLSEAKGSAAQVALRWLAWLFDLPIESLQHSKKIGVDVQPSAHAFYGKGTFDVVMEDVDDIVKALDGIELQIESGLTVGDFCNLVERLDKEKPKSCERLLRSWQRIMSVDQQPRWRRLLFKVFGA